MYVEKLHDGDGKSIWYKLKMGTIFFENAYPFFFPDIPIFQKRPYCGYKKTLS